jgi:hypothetical protein
MDVVDPTSVGGYGPAPFQPFSISCRFLLQFILFHLHHFIFGFARAGVGADAA